MKTLFPVCLVHRTVTSQGLHKWHLRRHSQGVPRLQIAKNRRFVAPKHCQMNLKSPTSSFIVSSCHPQNTTTKKSQHTSNRCSAASSSFCCASPLNVRSTCCSRPGPGPKGDVKSFWYQELLKKLWYLWYDSYDYPP